LLKFILRLDLKLGASRLLRYGGAGAAAYNLARRLGIRKCLTGLPIGTLGFLIARGFPLLVQVN